MKIIGVVIDHWKLTIFKKHFDESGFKYTEYNGPIENCITLQVETNTIAELHPVIKAASDEARPLDLRRKPCQKLH